MSADLVHNGHINIINEGRKLGINSQKNFPVKTIIDPLLTMSAPNSAVISSAMDSLVHCVDSFGSVRSTPLSKMFSIEGFKSTFNFLLKENLNDPVSVRMPVYKHSAIS